MRQPLAGVGDEVTGLSRYVECALAARLDDAEAGGIAAAAFVSASSEADPAGGHGMEEGALGIVFGRRQPWSVHESEHRRPIVEYLARERTHLVLGLVLVALAVPLHPGEQPLDGR